MGLPATTNALVWVFTSGAIIVVTLRLIARLHLTKAAGWDDSVIVIALIINILSACFASYAISRGVGHPLHAIPVDEGVDAAKWAAIADAFALMSFTVPKLSVAILLCRILNVLINTRLKRFLLTLPAVLSIIWAAGNEGFWFGQCQPLEALWDKRIRASHCLDPMYFRNQGIALCAFSAAADIFYALFPICFVRHLHMSRSKKIHLGCMLGLGVIGGIVAIWKTTQFVGISVPDADVTEASAHLIYATLIEANLLVVAACVPTVLPVVRAAQKKAGGAAQHTVTEGLERTVRSPGLTSHLARPERLRAALRDDSARVTANARAGQRKTSRGRGRRGFPSWRYLETIRGGSGARRGDEEMGSVAPEPDPEGEKAGVPMQEQLQKPEERFGSLDESSAEPSEEIEPSISTRGETKDEEKR